MFVIADCRCGIGDDSRTVSEAQSDGACRCQLFASTSKAVVNNDSRKAAAANAFLYRNFFIAFILFDCLSLAYMHLDSAPNYLIVLGYQII